MRRRGNNGNIKKFNSFIYVYYKVTIYEKKSHKSRFSHPQNDFYYTLERHISVYLLRRTRGVR